MIKKLVAVLSFIIMFLVCTTINAQAFTTDKYDIQETVNKLNELVNFDCISLINRNELIGYRLSNFEMYTGEYKRNIIAARDNIIQGLNKVDLIENSTDFSDSEKEMQLRQIYNNTDYAISDVNSKTISYLMSLSKCMPTLTYQRFLHKFQDYYNDLNITDSKLLQK